MERNRCSIDEIAVLDVKGRGVTQMCYQVRSGTFS